LKVALNTIKQTNQSTAMLLLFIYETITVNKMFGQNRPNGRKNHTTTTAPFAIDNVQL
jgi:hypothetical protein